MSRLKIGKVQRECACRPVTRRRYTIWSTRLYRSSFECFKRRWWPFRSRSDACGWPMLEGLLTTSLSSSRDILVGVVGGVEQCWLLTSYRCWSVSDPRRRERRRLSFLPIREDNYKRHQKKKHDDGDGCHSNDNAPRASGVAFARRSATRRWWLRSGHLCRRCNTWCW